MKLLSLIFFAAATSAFANNEVAGEYTTRGMQGLKLYCDTEVKLNYVRKYVTEEGFDFTRLTNSPSIPVEVLVAARQLKSFKRNLAANGIRYEIDIPDAYEAAEKESAMLKVFKKENPETFNTFPDYDKFKQYLKEIAQASKVTTYFVLGNTTEGREIAAVKISTGGEDKPAVFIDAGIHAREWIAPTTALYAITELSLSNKVQELLEKVDFYIVPVLNPDGYAFTHTSSSNRLWRKTRSETISKKCRGVDGNRNFDFQWMVSGASSNPCAETYAGSKPFSEPETLAVKNFLSSKNNIVVYLTIHSYGNYMLHPWGYTYDLPESEPTLRQVAEEAAAALAKIRGTSYTVGSSTRLLGPGAGGSDDWALALSSAELSYTIELPGGRYGFAPPPSEIRPVGQETFEAIKVYAKYAAEKSNSILKKTSDSI